MHDLHEYSPLMIMTMKPNNPSFGLPDPITELTTTQDFKLRKLEILLEKPETRKEDIITVFIALQEQAYVLSNCLENLIKKWPKPPTDMDPLTTEEALSMFGISSECKD